MWHFFYWGGRGDGIKREVAGLIWEKILWADFVEFCNKRAMGFVINKLK